MNAFTTPVRIAIVGSRGFAPLELVRDYVARLHPGCTVLTGGARGVAPVAARAARDRGLAVVVHHADWARHGRAAGPIRNRQIVAECQALVAFWDGGSRGTAHVVEQAKAARRPIELVVVGPRQRQEVTP
jgi:hypothetical protein